MKKKTKKDIIILSLLVILFLILRLVVLFTFQGILGGDETQYINKIIHSIINGNLNILDLLLNNTDAPHQWIPLILQIPFTLPFYFLFPTNEFSAFLGVVLSNLILLVLLFFFLKKCVNIKTAIFASLAFIFSPIGYTISSISSDVGGKNLFVFVLVPFLFLFLNEDEKKRHLSMFVLVILPLFTPYHLILWPTCFTYLVLEKFLNKKTAFSLKELKLYFRNFILGLIILLPVYAGVYLPLTPMVENTTVFKNLRLYNVHHDYIHLQVPDFTRLKEYSDYFIQPFIGQDIINFNNLELLTYSSLIVYLGLLFICFAYSVKEVISTKHINFSFLFFLYLFFYIVVDLIFNNVFFRYTYRTLAIRTQYLHIFLFMSFIFISIFAYKNKKFSVLFYLFLLLNLIINLSTLSLNNNNFINYNLGNFDYARESGIFNVTVEKVSDSLNLGLRSRETELNAIRDRDSEIDYTLYGYGLNLYYKNSLGINFCNRLFGEKTLKCKQGYNLNETSLRQYLKREYNLTEELTLIKD